MRTRLFAAFVAPNAQEEAGPSFAVRVAFRVHVSQVDAFSLHPVLRCYPDEEERREIGSKC
ncbi:MAG: hypothetical protein WA633_22265 [Stellaceae bacterium]